MATSIEYTSTNWFRITDSDSLQTYFGEVSERIDSGVLELEEQDGAFRIFGVDLAQSDLYVSATDEYGDEMDLEDWIVANLEDASAFCFKQVIRTSGRNSLSMKIRARNSAGDSKSFNCWDWSEQAAAQLGVARDANIDLNESKHTPKRWLSLILLSITPQHMTSSTFLTQGDPSPSRLSGGVQGPGQRHHHRRNPSFPQYGQQNR